MWHCINDSKRNRNDNLASYKNIFKKLISLKKKIVFGYKINKKVKYFRMQINVYVTHITSAYKVLSTKNSIRYTHNINYINRAIIDYQIIILI